MSRRIKAVSEIKARWEFDSVIDETVELQLKKEKIELARDKTLLEVREMFDKDIAALAEKMEANVLRAEKYALEHRGALLPTKLKSGETTFAFFGFRTGNPTLVLLNRKWTWEKVVAAIKHRFGFETPLIVRREIPNKDLLKENLDDSELASIGARIDQKETFFIEPKRDPADPHRLIAEPKAAA